MTTEYDYDVIQIGYGPVSKVSALILERMGWKVGIFERYGEVYPLPRAVCIDHEVFRMLHANGLGPIADAVTSPTPPYRWFNADWKELLSIDWSEGSVSGSDEVMFVHQPSFERQLDSEVKRRAGIDAFFETECTGFEQAADHVTVQVRDTKTGATRSHTAKYLIGVDGANSIVRENLGITRTDLGFEADWLVVDFVLKDGLTASQLGLIECGQYCNPLRPTTIVPGGIEDGRVCRRWEFMRLPHETKEEMVDEAKVMELLGDWIKPEQGDLVRHALYTFRSLLADEWRRDRIFLAGDAAHLMPPFMGQGMCAGLRDVWNLAWKLDRVMRGEAENDLLDTYMPERRPHVRDVIEASMFLGSIICIPDEAAAAERDEMFLSGNAPPPAPFPILTDGFLARDGAGATVAPAGELSPHGTVRTGRRTGRLDSFVRPGFTLITSEAIGPVSEAAQKVLKELDVSRVEVAPRVAARDDQIADTQGNILSWMETHGVEAILVRPDHFVFGGAADDPSLEALIAELARQAGDMGLISLPEKALETA